MNEKECKQKQAIKKFQSLNEQLKSKGYTMKRKEILNNIEIYYLDLKINKQIGWFLSVSNEKIIQEMQDNFDL